MADLWQELKTSGLPDELVDELREAYTELKEHFFLGKHRPAELEAGRFSEAVFRVLQWATGGLPDGTPYTPLSKTLPRLDQEIERLKNRPSKYDKSLRVRIPRVLRSIYDVRSGRGVAHLSGEVDPNLADATLVSACADWTLAELLRLYHGVPLGEAQALVDGLVKRQVPLVEMFGDFPKVLRADLSNPKKTLLMLYNRGDEGASLVDLSRWLKVTLGAARQTLQRLDARAEVHFDEVKGTAFITKLGIKKVEAMDLP